MAGRVAPVRGGRAWQSAAPGYPPGCREITSCTARRPGGHLPLSERSKMMIWVMSWLACTGGTPVETPRAKEAVPVDPPARVELPPRPRAATTWAPLARVVAAQGDAASPVVTGLQLRATEQGRQLAAGLAPGWDDGGVPLQLDPGQTFGAEDAPADGRWALVALQVPTGDPECSHTVIGALDPTVVDGLLGPDSTGAGGKCVDITIAHSLLRRLGGLRARDEVLVVDAGIGPPEQYGFTPDEYWKLFGKWDPAFLRSIRVAGRGEPDEGEEAQWAERGLDDDAFEQAHVDLGLTGGVKLTTGLDDVTLFDGDEPTCDEVRAACARMPGPDAANDVTQADYSLRLSGIEDFDGPGGEAGTPIHHRVYVHSATMTDSPCCCVVSTLRTNSQEEPVGGANGAITPFTNIPYIPNPDPVWYKFCEGAEHATSNEFYFGLFDGILLDTIIPAPD